MFWGLMDVLTKRYNWGEPLTTDSDTVAAFWRTIISDNRDCFEAARDMANKGCGSEFDAIYRYDENGLREISFDGGDTWADDTSDPRVSGTIIPPPMWFITGGDNRCKAAVTARINTKNALDEILTTGVDVGFSGLIGIIVGVICAISAGVACGIAGIAGAIATIIIQVGATVLQNSLTTEVYDQFECILFCHINSDATFLEANWQAVKQAIATDMSGDPEFVLWNWVNMLGPAGLTNIARLSIDVIADCSDCACECSDPVLGAFGQNLQARPDLGTGWWQVETEFSGAPGCEPNGCYYAEIYVPGCCEHDAYNIVGGTNAPPGNRLATGCDSTQHTGNYGVGECVQYILFRAYEECIFEFRLIECPA